MARRVLSPPGVLLAFVAGGLLLRWLTTGTWDAVRGGNPTFDDLLVFVVAVLAWGVFAWLALGTLLTALSALPGVVGSACDSLAERLTPAVYRRAARVALGLSVAAGPVLGMAPAHAATVDQPTQTATAQMLPDIDRPGATDSRQLPGGFQMPVLDRPGSTEVAQDLPLVDRPVTDQPGLPNPDRPETRDPVTRPPTRSGTEAQQEYVVKRGDTLWDIARQRLPDGASGVEITQEWHRWYDANRQVIGDDPDLILPGQVLTPPSNGR